jgi:ElaB/YqjD/DUF883 family membrane-anchored ribosome-binding protein
MDMTTTADVDVKKLQAEIANLREDMARLVDTLGGAARANGANAFANAKARAGDFQDDLKDKIESLTRQIEEKPVASSLTAFFIGVLLGMIFGRR